MYVGDRADRSPPSGRRSQERSTMTRKNVLIIVGDRPRRRGASSPPTSGIGATRRSTVTTDAIKTRDLEAIVSASGKIQPKRLVNISADTPGRVVDLAVNEGDRVTHGPVPAADRSAVAAHARRQRHRVAAGARRGSLEQMRQSVETARVQLEQAQQNLDAPAGSLEQAAHDARSAREGRERRAGRRVGAAGAREAGRRAGERASSRSAPASRAPATI